MMTRYNKERLLEASSTLYSLIMTCKENNIEPFAYFNAMLPQLRLCEAEQDYEQLLPFNMYAFEYLRC